jgi:predicted RNase H-like HicB family nuclease
VSEYVVIYEQAEDGGWWAYSPDLPGVVSTADSRREAEHDIREALTLHIEELRRQGKAVPAPGSRAGTVEV